MTHKCEPVRTFPDKNAVHVPAAVIARRLEFLIIISEPITRGKLVDCLVDTLELRIQLYLSVSVDKSQRCLALNRNDVG
jgi:hypothetical protein